MAAVVVTMMTIGVIIQRAVDARGIPGWEKVDLLARALIDLNGLSISNEEARNIQAL